MMNRLFGNVLISLALALLLATGCVGEGPTGLYRAAQGTGPKVKFDLDHRPLPEIPLPNDTATRIDITSPSGRRINVSEEAPTELERDVRRKINRLEGFGVYQAITVGFDKPLDLDNIINRHQKNVDFMDDAVYVLNLNTRSHKYGQAVLLDFGRGNFPLALKSPSKYFTNDPRSTVANLLFDTTDEDLNNNGLLELTEDTDGDGVLDKPNVHPAGGDPVDDLLNYYEKETDTLIMRPVVPLEQESTYAVVLTKRLIGVDGNPVRSPFEYINHVRQNGALKNLRAVLRNYGLDYDDVSFVWTFTTLGTTRDLEALRRGIYGNGPFSFLNREFPAKMDKVHLLKDSGADRHLLDRVTFKSVIGLLVDAILGSAPQEQIDVVTSSYNNVDYFISGELIGPNYLADRDGIAEPGYPADDDEIWELNRLTGEGFYAPTRIPFWCAIPRADRGQGAPFPVAFYGHGYGGQRLEMLGFAGNLARHGIASCTLDAYGHGAGLARLDKEIIGGLLADKGLRGIFDAMVPSRARDLNNDGIPDSGGDFWTADTFHTRDIVRQSILDHLMLIRLLRSFDGVRKWGNSLDGVSPDKPAGDFNGDGVVDLGGPKADYFAWGQSLGGIISSVLAGVDPAITAAAPTSGGGGLLDVALRSDLGGVLNAVLLRIMGPLVVGVPGGNNGEVTVKFIVNNANARSEPTIHTSSKIREGDLVRVVNLSNGETDQVVAVTGGKFRLQIATDAMNAVEKRALLKIDTTAANFQPQRLTDTRPFGDLLEITVFDGTDVTKVREVINTFGEDVAFQGTVYPKGQPLVSLVMGFGHKRNTPDLRRFMMISQMILDQADPAAYAPHFHLNPLYSNDYDTATPGANVLVIPTCGDSIVPVNTGVAIARAAGIIELFNKDPRYGKTQNEVLIDNYVIEGVARFKRFDNDPRFTGKANVQTGSTLLDVDNLSGADMDVAGTGDHFKAPRLDPPLRLSVHTHNGLAGMRIPYLSKGGTHGFALPEPTWRFDTHTFMIHQVGHYFKTRGREIRDDVCMQDGSCTWMPPQAAP